MWNRKCSENIFSLNPFSFLWLSRDSVFHFSLPSFLASFALHSCHFLHPPMGSILVSATSTHTIYRKFNRISQYGQTLTIVKGRKDWTEWRDVLPTEQEYPQHYSYCQNQKVGFHKQYIKLWPVRLFIDWLQQDTTI